MFHQFFSNQEEGFWRFYSDTKIFFGRGSLNSKLPLILNASIPKIGVLTDEFVSELPFFQSLVSNLKSLIACDFMKIGYESDVVSILDAVHFFKQNKVDTILAVGGGSVLDASKIVATLVSNDLSIKELAHIDALVSPPVPLICIPTTFGTGSEVNMYAHINDVENNQKIGIKKSWLTPSITIIDPQILDLTPPDLKFIWGIDAFCHVLEVGCLKHEASPIQRVLMRYAVEIIVNNLKLAVEQNDKAANEKIAMASLLGGLGIHNSRTGLIHALSVPLAKKLELPHAISLFPIISTVMAFQGRAMFNVFYPDIDYPLLQEEVFFKNIPINLETERFQSLDADELTREASLDRVIFKENFVPITKKEITLLYKEIIFRLHTEL